MKDKEQDVYAQAAAQMNKAFPPIVQTITQDKADLERLYPKGGDGKSSIARHPTQQVTDFLPEAHKALIDALERVLLDPKIVALPPTEQARLAAQLLIAESAANRRIVTENHMKAALAFKPRNPFTLPELVEHEAVFPASQVKAACSLAAHYIAARERSDKESAENFDYDIFEFLMGQFDSLNAHALFCSRFVTMLADCNAAFGSLNHSHTRWAYPRAQV